MKKQEIDRLIKLRQFVIDYYKTLDGNANPSTAVTLQRDVAAVLESTVRSLEDVLSDYVNFQ
tara:strand:- start:178 stop:363 length:186 start_codon:yes stop_codon:yes gene_type:complete